MLLQELARYNQWVVRRADKVPLNPRTGYTASPINPSDWSDYATAVACCTDSNGIGLGFVLTDSDPFAVIDLDDTQNPKLLLTPEQREYALQFQKTVAGAFRTYSEASPSGKGLHIWCKGSVPSGVRKSELATELYSSGRYMTITGQAFQDVPLADCQSLLTPLWETMGGSLDSTPVASSKPQEQSDEEVCRLAATGANGNGEMFVELYKNNWQPFFPSQSEADLTFCNIVAFYTNNQEQVARIYWESELFKQSPKRKRKSRPDYLFHPKWGLVTKAFDQKGPELPTAVLAAIQSENPLGKTKPNDKVIQSVVLPDAGVGVGIAGNDSASDSPNGAVENEAVVPPVDWLPPPGLMGMVAEFIYTNAVNPVKEVAIAASIAYLAGIAGRGYNISSTGLNHYVVLLANTSGGKEGGAQGMDKLTHAVREQVPAFERFIGPSDIASPQALVKQLVETPCMLSHKGEFGIWLQKLTGKYAKANEVSLRGLLLELFTRSGAKQTLRGAVYSDRAKNVPAIDSPAFSMFGDSTQQEFYKAIDETSITEGLVPRLTVIQSSDARPIFNDKHNTIKPSPELVFKLGALAKRCLELEMLKAPVNIQETQEAKEFQLGYRELCMDRVFADRENPVAQIWTRAHLRMLKLAGLIAVGVDPDAPIVTIEHYHWARTAIEHGINVISQRFDAGTVGEVNYTLEQRIHMGRLIRRFVKGPYNEVWNHAYGVDKEMFNARVITHRYLLNNSNKKVCFRNDRNPQMAFSNIINELTAAGNLVKIELNKVKGSAKYGVAYYITDLGGLAPL